MITEWFTYEKQQGLYHNKSILASLLYKGLAAKYTTEKWTILVICLQIVESPEVEKEVKRLLRTDLSASNVNILFNKCTLHAWHWLTVESQSLYF